MTKSVVIRSYSTPIKKPAERDITELSLLPEIKNNVSLVAKEMNMEVRPSRNAGLYVMPILESELLNLAMFNKEWVCSFCSIYTDASSKQPSWKECRCLRPIAHQRYSDGCLPSASCRPRKRVHRRHKAST